jgi:hypothetical protein
MRSRTCGTGSTPCWCMLTARKGGRILPSHPALDVHMITYLPGVSGAGKVISTPSLATSISQWRCVAAAPLLGRHTARGRRLPHTTDRGRSAVDKDQSPPAPDPLYVTKTPAGRRSSCPVSAPGGQPDPHHSSSGSGADSPPDQHRGRHRRARLSWWRPRIQPSTVGKVTVAELQRRGERERAYARRARRVRVLPRPRCAGADAHPELILEVMGKVGKTGGGRPLAGATLSGG